MIREDTKHLLDVMSSVIDISRHYLHIFRCHSNVRV